MQIPIYCKATLHVSGVTAPITVQIRPRRRGVAAQMHLYNVNKYPTDATVCRYLFTTKLLYMFRVSQHPSSGVEWKRNLVAHGDAQEEK